MPLPAPVTILGGASWIRRISIMSSHYVATARASYDGSITCVVRSRSRLANFFRRHPQLPVPKIIRMLLFLLEGLGFFGKVFVGFLLCDALFSKYVPALPAPTPPSDVLLSDLLYVQALFMIAVCAPILYFVHRLVATWHGAEHMAIAAYERTRSSDLQMIAVQDRVHPKCGGRIMLPYLTATFLVTIVGYYIPLPLLLILVIHLELLLQLDARIGFDRIPVFSHASTLLQRHITTRDPGDLELRTAQCALQELLAAHAADRT